MNYQEYVKKYNELREDIENIKKDLEQKQKSFSNICCVKLSDLIEELEGVLKLKLNYELDFYNMSMCRRGKLTKEYILKFFKYLTIPKFYIYFGIDETQFDYFKYFEGYKIDEPCFTDGSNILDNLVLKYDKNVEKEYGGYTDVSLEKTAMGNFMCRFKLEDLDVDAIEDKNKKIVAQAVLNLLDKKLENEEISVAKVRK